MTESLDFEFFLRTQLSLSFSVSLSLSLWFFSLFFSQRCYFQDRVNLKLSSVKSISRVSCNELANTKIKNIAIHFFLFFRKKKTSIRFWFPRSKNGSVGDIFLIHRSILWQSKWFWCWFELKSSSGGICRRRRQRRRWRQRQRRRQRWRQRCRWHEFQFSESRMSERQE